MNAEDLIRRADDLAANRTVFESVWQDVSEYCFPQSQDFLGGWSSGQGLVSSLDGASQLRGQAKRKTIYDSTAMYALDRFAAAIESMIAPRSVHWHGLAFENIWLRKQHDVREWCEDVTSLLFRLRYAPKSGFGGALQEVLKSVGAYGCGILYIENGEDTGQDSPIIYRCIPLNEVLIAQDSRGKMDTVFRRYSLSARQAVQRFGDKVHADARAAAQKPAEMDRRFEFLEVVMPRDKRQPGIETNRNSKYVEYIIDMKARAVIATRGYFEMPFIDFRLNPVPGEIYGHSPAMMALPDIKSANAMARDMLRSSQQMVNPPLAVAERTEHRINLNAGKVNYGMIDPASGQLLIKPILTGGNPGSAQTILDGRRKIIQEGFYMNLFNVQNDAKNMTATEALIRQQEKAQMLGPIGARIQQSLAQMVDREMAVLKRQGMFNPRSQYAMPQMINGMDYEIEFTSPLDRARRSDEAAGAIRYLEVLQKLAGHDKTVMDNLDLDAMARGIADIYGMPLKFLKSDAELNYQRAQQDSKEADQGMQDMVGQLGPMMQQLTGAAGSAGATGGSRLPQQAQAGTASAGGDRNPDIMSALKKQGLDQVPGAEAMVQQIVNAASNIQP